jgi:hypothetical protein
MSYSSLIKNSQEKVYQYAIATKILDLMDKLRMDEIGKSKRRWIWELMQNAKDVKYPDKAVNIQVNLDEGFLAEQLEFKHDGRSFSIDNITFLIEQVSTKERGVSRDVKLKTTGKFGTGFLTTHLLSEIVTVLGYVKEPNLPYKQFELQLDRSGRSIEDITESIRKSSEVLSMIEEAAPSTDYNEKNFNTIFRYPLDDEGISVAKTGLQDLENTLPYTMIFVPEIKSVAILGDGVMYTALDNVIEQENGVRIHTIKKETIVGEVLIHIAALSTNKTSIAIPVAIGQDDTITITSLPFILPRLFCDFPLIGSEDFHIPIVINSSYFNPNEPRSGVFLTDRDNEKVNENKAILAEAIGLYKVLLEHASEKSWNGMYNLANVFNPPEKDWLSSTWYNDHVLNPIYNVLSIVPIVDTETNGRQITLGSDNKPSIWFPYSSKKEIREKTWLLCNNWIPNMMPKFGDVHSWYSVLWNTCGKLSVKTIANSVQTFKNVKTLKSKLTNGVDPIQWLNSFFDLVNCEGKFLDEILSDKYELLPNQLGEFSKMTELYLDNNIEEEFKDILSLLGENIRIKLRERTVITINKYEPNIERNIRHHPRKPEDIVARINKLIPKSEGPVSMQVAIDLVSLFPLENENDNRNLLYEICKKIFARVVKEKKNILYNNADIWIQADIIVINSIITNISECKTLQAFVNKYEFESNQAALLWLDQFITFLKRTNNEHHLNVTETPILPNQNGDFRIKEMLFLDDDSIDEKLKNISEKLDFHVRANLLDKRIFLELPENRVLSQKLIADKITTLILPKLAELPRTKETKEVFTLMYLWFRENKHIAAATFGELYMNRHKLYDDDEVASNMQKAEDLKQLMEEFQIVSIDQLRDIINNSSNKDNIDFSDEPDVVPITRETLVSLGIGSLIELDEALKDVNLAKVFLHNSVPTVEMFEYAQGLIKRAKKNILAYLETLDQYDCSEVDHTAPTILAGIKYNGTYIDIVARPSDNGEVIIYYSSEKDVLEIAESQLWIDDNIEDPQLLTLGKILKVTGITKIPIK